MKEEHVKDKLQKEFLIGIKNANMRPKLRFGHTEALLCSFPGGRPTLPESLAECIFSFFLFLRLSATDLGRYVTQSPGVFLKVVWSRGADE